jgi:pimeloyl-ACP methyl ester carboxylesterase
VGDTLFGKPLPEKRWASAMKPVLVMDGGNSDTGIRNSAAALAGVLPNAKARTMDGQDHSAPFTAPEAFVPVLVEFLAGAQKAS